MIVLQTQNPIELLSLISLVSSLVSLIIGAFAIWLSIKFYKWSTEAAEKTNEAAKNISSNVQKLDTLFDRLYSDTFGMMKDTVADMRKHIWTKNYTDEDLSDKIEEKANDKINEVKKEINSELSELIKRLGKTEEKVDSYKDISELIDKAISETRKIETEVKRTKLDSGTLNSILRFLDGNDSISIKELIESPTLSSYSESVVIAALDRYIKDNLIEPIDLKDFSSVVKRIRKIKK